MSAAAPRPVGFDRRAITIDGRRTLLLSGAIHYPRSTPELWPSLIQSSRDAGLNAIETYVFWNLHEARRGVFDFSGRLDLPAFCQLVQDAGMYLVLRIGPYICAETNYGGLPFWLRDVPDMQMRTLNDPWQREMARWTRFVVDLVRPYLAPNGGPIILAQIENEYNLIKATYGEEGQRYLAWAADFANRLDIGIPWVMCKGGAPGTIETLNAFLAHEEIPELRARQPDQPLLWTEHWTGWYDIWGYPHHRRDPREVAYGSARFLAAGGTGINYYMWHGGTNFGREGMYQQTASYDYDAPLDEFGRPTTKYHHLARLHRVITEQSALMLDQDGPNYSKLAPEVGKWAYGPLTFICNDDPVQTTTVRYLGNELSLPPRSAKVFVGDDLRFDSATIDIEVRREGRSVALRQRAVNYIGQWREPVGGEKMDAPMRETRVVAQPVDQLTLTRDTTDYCWYNASFTLVEGLPATTLTIQGIGDVAHCFVDKQLVATTEPLILPEERTFFDGEDFVRTFELPPLATGRHTLSILSVAIGLIKGDWLIAHHNMVLERKGIWGSVEIPGVTLEGWQMVAGLAGEQAQIAGVGMALVNWSTDRQADPLTWWRFAFEHPGDGDALVLDLAGMSRGLIWLNGQLLGRYWLATSRGHPMAMVAQYADLASDIPTQRYYHVPHSWLRAQNTLVLFDELGGDPEGIQIIRP